MTTDAGIHQQISALVNEEKQLRTQREAGQVDAGDELARLKEIEVQLDQCWDLLRQREAIRNAGGDPDSAAVRPAGEVEGYIG